MNDSESVAALQLKIEARLKDVREARDIDRRLLLLENVELLTAQLRRELEQGKLARRYG